MDVKLLEEKSGTREPERRAPVPPPPPKAPPPRAPGVARVRRIVRPSTHNRRSAASTGWRVC